MKKYNTQFIFAQIFHVLSGFCIILSVFMQKDVDKISILLVGIIMSLSAIYRYMVGVVHGD